MQERHQVAADVSPLLLQCRGIPRLPGSPSEHNLQSGKRGRGGAKGGGEGETIIIHCDSIQVFDSQSEIFDDEEAGSAELGAEIFEFRIRGDT